MHSYPVSAYIHSFIFALVIIGKFAYVPFAHIVYTCVCVCIFTCMDARVYTPLFYRKTPFTLGTFTSNSEITTVSWRSLFFLHT
jgi:hypothetical protein